MNVNKCRVVKVIEKTFILSAVSRNTFVEFEDEDILLRMNLLESRTFFSFFRPTPWGKLN